MFKLKSLLVFTLTISFLLSLSQVEAARHNCPATRPDSSTCYVEGSTYQPVCAYTTKNCPFGACGRTEYNGCSACSDKNISYYYDGECPPEVSINTCYPDVCRFPDGSEDWENSQYFNPVCGIERRCQSNSRNCKRTFNNYCNSCARSSYPFYQNGPCEHNKNYCPKRRPSSCNNRNEPVCANYTDPQGSWHWVTVNNWCTACKDPAVSYYLNGKCGKPLYNETHCLPSARPQFCTKEYNPVCIYYNTSNGTIEHKVASNACTACSEKNGLYHTPGPCQFWCNRNPMIAVDCAGSLEPVCGTYKENGVTKTASLRNGCVGCYYNVIEVETFVDGLCPGDNGILCAYNGVAFLDGILEPVCALSTVNCNSNGCRKTFGDSLSACRDGGYVKYIPGVCPGDYGVPCTDFRNGNPNNDKNVYANVCGYRSYQCSSSSCRSDYDDQFDACGNSNVLYFKAGPCS